MFDRQTSTFFRIHSKFGGVLHCCQSDPVWNELDWQLSSESCENIIDDFLSHWLLRREEQVVHDCVVTVPHRQGLWHNAEPSNILQPVAETPDDSVVALLDQVGAGEEVLLRTLSVGRLLP